MAPRNNDPTAPEKKDERLPQIEWGTMGKNSTLPHNWGLASSMTSEQVRAGAATLKFHFSGMITFKYLLESGSLDEGGVVYRHCNGKQPPLVFRYSAAKLIQVEVDTVVSPNIWQLALTNPLSGNRRTIKSHIKCNWKSVVSDIRDKWGVDKTYKAVLLNDKAETINARGNTLLKNVLKVPSSASTIKRMLAKPEGI